MIERFEKQINELMNHGFSRIKAMIFLIKCLDAYNSLSDEEKQKINSITQDHDVRPVNVEHEG